MENSKAIFVTGATGNQGGAVARSLSQQGFTVKALTRNINSAKAQALLKHNVQLLKGDLNNADTYREHLKGIDGVFSVQTYEQGIDKEINQGITLATAAKEYEVKHFIYTSVVGADLNTGIPHWDSKLKIEQHIKQINLPFTILRPVSLFENFLIPQVKVRITKGKLSSPVNKNAVQQYISAQDIGNISTAIFSNPERYLGKTLMLAAEQMDTQQVALLFSKVLGKEITYQKLPGIITWLAMGKNLYKMFKWINENDCFPKENVETTRKEFPDLLSLESWIKMNFTLNK